MRRSQRNRLPVFIPKGKHLLYGFAILFLIFTFDSSFGIPTVDAQAPRPGESEGDSTALEPGHWEEDGVVEEFAQGDTRIEFKDILGDGRFKYRFLPDPPRFYVDILEPRRTLSWNRLPLKGEAFNQVRIGRYEDKVRLTFDLRDNNIPEPLVEAKDSNLIIHVSMNGPDAGKSLPRGGPELPVQTPKAKSADTVKVAKADFKPVRVMGIDFQQTETSSDIIIEREKKTVFNVEEEDNKILVQMPGVEIPARFLRHLDTSGFPSEILSVFPEQTGSGPSTQAKITIHLREKTPFDVLQEGNSLRIRVMLPDQKPSITPLPPVEIPASMEVAEKTEPAIASEKEGKKSPQAQAVQKKEDKKGKPSGPTAAKNESEKQKENVRKTVEPRPQIRHPLPPRSVQKQKEIPSYIGRKISLDFKDADIQNVLKLIAEVSGKNIVISDAVQAKVTIKLVNVPWDQALDVILKTYALDKEELAENILRVAPYTQLKTERDEALRASQALKQVKNLVTEVVPVNYAKADKLQILLERIKSTRPDAGILVDKRTNALIIKDLPANVEEMVRLIRELDTPTPQVLIEARIVELDVGFEKELGIQWGTLYRAGPATGNPTGLNFPATASVGGAWENVSGQTATGVSNPVVSLPASVSNTAGGALGFSLASITNSFQLDAQLSALQDKKHVRILSSPRVATLNNQEARIEQGQEVPFETTSDEGTKTEFKDAMLRLYVTPQINFDRSIIMKIVVSNDTPIADPNVNFIIQKKEAETTVLVNNGDTAVIGGIYTNEDQKTEGGIPWFMDVPIMGTLFKKHANTKNRTELIIFITPRIIPVRKVPVQEWIQ